jgi:hypothetical protein
MPLDGVDAFEQENAVLEPGAVERVADLWLLFASGVEPEDFGADRKDTDI